jgi:protein transport protein SEC23
MADAGAEFNMLEEVDAVRMVWNVWPYSRLEAAKCVIPFGVMYTPAKQTSNLQVRDFSSSFVPKKQDDCRQTTANNP